MPDKDFSLININLEALSEPITKLIETVANAVGILYEPTNIVRKAKAEAEASVIKAQGDIEAKELTLRASRRLDALEFRRQKNIEAIVKKATEQLPESVSKEKVEEDWIAQFFNHSQDISNEEMQLIWARLLAGEIEKPGSFSLRTLQLVRVLRQSDATLFRRFCNFIWNNQMHFYSHSTLDILGRKGIGYGELINLESLDLISLNEVSFGAEPGETLELNYIGKQYSLNAEGRLPRLPMYPLTDIGRELAPICGAEPDQEYLQEILTEWRTRGYRVAESES